jgi:hypothetical protein
MKTPQKAIFYSLCQNLVDYSSEQGESSKGLDACSAIAHAVLVALLSVAKAGFGYVLKYIKQ